MAHNNSEDTSFRDLVARLNAMSNITPEEERAQLMEAAGKAPKSESVITKAILESDADDSISTSIKKTMTEESKRLDKIAELEAQLAELKAEQKEEQTYDSKSFREVVEKDIAEYIKGAEDSALVELYNTISDNEAVYNEESSSILIKTPETTEIIADAEQAEAPAEEEQVDEKTKDMVDYDRNKEEPHAPEKDGEEEAEDKSDEKDDDGEVPMLDKDFDEGEEVELDMPAEDKFTNDLDPADKK